MDIRYLFIVSFVLTISEIGENIFHKMLSFFIMILYYVYGKIQVTMGIEIL